MDNVLHLSRYQERDHEVIDYQMYELGSTGLKMRGPELNLIADEKYIACIGAAQTFGCFCQAPYPDILGEELGMPVLNLGYGGAGPEFYLLQEALLPYINGGQFLVVQVMSGRSQSNSLFKCQGLEYLQRRSDGAWMGAAAAYRELMAGSSALRRLPLGRIGMSLSRRLAVPAARKIVQETREAWVQSYLQLLEKITVPVILLWFSKRKPRYVENYSSPSMVLGEFPQFVNDDMIDRIKDKFDFYVECVSDRGSPQKLISRFTGEATSVNPASDRTDLGDGKCWDENRYYPSPEMHEDAAAMLLPICLKLMTRIRH